MDGDQQLEPLTKDDIASRLISADTWSGWYRYLSDRTRISEPAYSEGVVYFPRELSASVKLARQSDVLSTNVSPRTAPAAVQPSAAVQPPSITTTATTIRVTW